MSRVRCVSALFICLVLCCAGSSAQTPASFTTRTFAAGNAARNLYAVDVNNDGVPDLIEDTTRLPNTLSVLIANGDGTFQAPRTIYTFPMSDQGSISLASGDFNGDGKVDLVVAPGGVNQLAVFLGNGDGTFQSPKMETIALPGGAWFGGGSIVTADFNHDGKLDLVTEGNTNTAGAEYLLPGNGNGTFAAPQAIYTPSANDGIGSVSVGDFDADGNADLAVVVNSNCNPGSCTTDLNVLYGNGKFGFTAEPAFSGSNFSFASGDVNSDGRTDLFGIGGANSNQLAVLTSQPGRHFTTFTLTSSAQLAGAAGTAAPVALADLNGDGAMDLATVGFSGSTSVFAMFLANGSGGYQEQTVDIPVGPNLSSVAAGDFNRDTKPDLAVVGYTNSSTAPTLNVAQNSTASGNWGGCAYPAKGQGIALCSPGSTSGASVSISASASSFGMLQRMELWIDGSKVADQYHAWENRAWFNQQTTLAPGTHRVVLFAADVDNRLQKFVASVTVGGGGCSAPSSPGVHLCSPASGATVSSPVQVAASATVSGKLAQMELWVDGVEKYHETTSTTLQTSISLSAGTHRFAVLAVNTSGQRWEQAVNATVK